MTKLSLKSVSGVVYGGYKQNAGKGKFKGKLRVYPGRKMSIANFKLAAGGKVKAMGFTALRTSKIYAAMKIYPKLGNVVGNYSSYVTGKVSKKKMYGNCNGTVVAWISPKKVWAKEL